MRSKKNLSLQRTIIASAPLLMVFAATAVLAQDIPIGVPQPIGNITAESLIGRIIRNVIGLTGVITLIMFIWGGFTYMTARGDAAKTKKGRDTIIWSTGGLLIIFSAYGIVSLILRALE
jgi:hypothetical protein